MENYVIYHAGDSDFIPEMKDIGDFDVALLPIGGTFTMDIPEAVDAVLTINPKVVIPMHRSKGDPNEFKKLIEAKSNIKVFPLDIGKSIKMDEDKSLIGEKKSDLKGI